MYVFTRLYSEQNEEIGAGKVAHTFDPSPQEAEASDLLVGGQPGLHSEFRTARAMLKDAISKNQNIGKGAWGTVSKPFSYNSDIMSVNEGEQKVTPCIC